MAQLIVERELSMKQVLVVEVQRFFSALNKFIVKLKDLEVVEKEDVVMTCQTKDTKTPGAWTRNGIKITSMPGGPTESP